MNSNISKCVFALLMLLLFVGINSVQAIDVERMQVNSSVPPINIDDLDRSPIKVNADQQIGPRRDVPTVEGRFLLVHGVNNGRDSQWGDIEGIFASNDLDYVRITDPADLANIDLSQFDVVWIGDWQTDEWNQTYNNYRTYIDNWVHDECGVLYHSSASNYNPTKPIHPGGLIYAGNDQQYHPYAYTAATQGDCYFFDLCNWDLNHYLTGNVFSHTRYEEADISDVAEGGDYQILVTAEQDGNGDKLVARYAYGNGQVVVTGTPDAHAIKYGHPWSAIDPNMFSYLMSLVSEECCDPIQMMEDLVDYINGMVDAGELNNNQANFLLYDLYGALRWAEQENCRYVISYLNDMLRRVATLVWWRVLSYDEGQYFVDAINDILDCIAECHDGNATLEGLIAAIENELPDVFNLSAAYPNPFNSTTTISFTLPFEMQTSLTVYDVSGRQVAMLADGVQQAGVHSAAFNADRLTTGMYFVVLNAGGKMLTQKVMLVR